jgi:NAD(P)-dependent dehydrogenase (short-subunit alcohol dehydrogenase family)
VFTHALDVNVVSLEMALRTFLPLVRKSIDGRVLTTSSTVGSLAAASKTHIPAVTVQYGVSKAATTAVTAFAMAHPDNKNLSVYAICPGHCATNLNAFKGVKDPRDGAKVAVELLRAEKGAFVNGFYNMEGDAKGPEVVPW